MNKATTVKEVLTAAKWILANVGWCQGAYIKGAKGEAYGTLGYLKNKGDTADCFCSLGAIASVECDNNLKNDAIIHLAKIVGGGMGGIVCWNDTPGRTKAQVLRQFDKAITKS